MIERCTPSARGLLAVIGACLSICITIPAWGSDTVFSFDVTRFELTGSSIGSFVDEFNDGVLSPWTSLNATEAAGVVTLASPGNHVPAPFGVSGVLDVTRVDRTFGITDGQGDFSASTTWDSFIPSSNHSASALLYYPINATTLRVIALFVVDAKPDVAARWGIAAGLSVSIGELLFDGNTQTSHSWSPIGSIAVEPDDVTGNIVLKYDYDDTAKEFVGSYSLNGGTSFSTPFGPAVSQMTALLPQVSFSAFAGVVISETLCADAIDNDLDELTDLEDPDCNGFEYPVLNDFGVFYATDQVDSDGYYDCQDFLAQISCIGPELGTHLGEDWNREDSLDCPVHSVGVYAAAQGVVIDALPDVPNWGNVIIVRHSLPHGKQVETMYAHVDQMFVSRDETVVRNQKIGTFGDGNGLYACHLHFELRVCGPGGRFGVVGPGYANGSTKTSRWRNPSDFIDANPPSVDLDPYVPSCDVVGAGENQTASLLGGSGTAGAVEGIFEDVVEGDDFSADYASANIVDLENQTGIDPATFTFALPDGDVQLWSLDFGGIFSGSVDLTFTYANSTPPLGQSQLAAESSASSFDPVLYQLIDEAWVSLDGIVSGETITVTTDVLSTFVLGTSQVVPVPSLSNWGLTVLVGAMIALGFGENLSRDRHRGE